MNIIELFQSFQTQDQAVEHLERVRWSGRPNCPYCKSENVGTHASPDRKGRRWQCHDCSCAFAVTVGTLFHGTHVSLRDWLLVLALMLDGKKSVSAYQISRDLGIRRPTVSSMMRRIRSAIANDPPQKELLYSIVEANEIYAGGRPKTGSKSDDDTPHSRGRGVKKGPIVNVVGHGNRVAEKTAPSADHSAKGLEKFVTRFVNLIGSLSIANANQRGLPATRMPRRGMASHTHEDASKMTRLSKHDDFNTIIDHRKGAVAKNGKRRHQQLCVGIYGFMCVLMKSRLNLFDSVRMCAGVPA